MAEQIIGNEQAAVKPCKRGGTAGRDKSGHCICDACKEFNKKGPVTDEQRAYYAEWRRQNREKCASYNRKWINENKEQRKEIVESWRSRNPENVKAINARAGKKWAANNPGKRMASVRARQLSKIQRTPRWADLQEIARIYEECARVTVESGVKHEVDHIYPLQGETVSGLHVHQNLQIITRTQNRSKGNKA